MTSIEASEENDGAVNGVWMRMNLIPAESLHTLLLFLKLLQRGRVVSASDSQSGGPGFESRSGHLLDLGSVVPSLNSRPRL